ncbi:MAG: cysteine--tRNA ligase, partial [Candidatus Aureabacteria bacterium]|nr:cysteine--tRNA ligase [Candidatus Auribacterota bacterium]
MSRLNVLPADDYPKATDNIPGMHAIIAGLLEKGIAYRTARGVFFSVGTFPAYGELSRRDLEEMRAGARVKIDEEKKSPLDFALWKASAPDEPAWESSWGAGRPGWHIECSAMSMSRLGPSFDIPGGGQDLIFPHHENEKAQSEAYTGKPFVRYWLHNGFITINQEKMSKSLGNVANLRELFNACEPRAVRYFLLGTHYRSPIDFSPEGLEGAKTALNRLDNCRGIAEAKWGVIAREEADPNALGAFTEAMDDDFNTAGAVGLAHSLANDFFQAPDGPGARAKVAAMIAICEVLGLEIKNRERKIEAVQLSEHLERIEELLIRDKIGDQEIDALIRARQALRRKKQWELADRIRKKFERM